MNLNHRILTREEERQLILQYRGGDKSAGDTLVSCHQLLVAKEARRWMHSGLPFEDLMQEANIGVLKALAKYDPARGIRFMTYAKNWMKAYLMLRIMHDFSLVKIGTTQAQRSLFFRLRTVLARLRAEGVPEEKLVAEAARLSGVKEREVEEMVLRTSRHDYSLDTPLASDDEPGATHLDRLEDHSESAEAALEAWDEHWERKALVREALDGLQPRERFIIEKRVMSERPMTLKELGEHFGLSRERARQLELSALRKLRKRIPAAEAA